MLDAFLIPCYYHNNNMKNKTTKNIKSSSEIKERYHQEIIVKPAERLLEALLKAEAKEVSAFTKIQKVSSASR